MEENRPEPTEEQELDDLEPADEQADDVKGGRHEGHIEIES